jgi:hypothetical protein
MRQIIQLIVVCSLLISPNFLFGQSASQTETVLASRIYAPPKILSVATSNDSLFVQANFVRYNYGATIEQKNFRSLIWNGSDWVIDNLPGLDPAPVRPSVKYYNIEGDNHVYVFANQRYYKLEGGTYVKIVAEAAEADKLITHNGNLIGVGNFTDVAGYPSSLFYANIDGAVSTPIYVQDAANMTTATDIALLGDQICVVGNGTHLRQVSDAFGLSCWVGSSWSRPVDINGHVSSIEVYNDELYVGGTFKMAGGAQIYHFARVNVGSIQPVGNVNGHVNDIHTVDGKLYVAGLFDNVDGKSTKGFAVYNGSSWDAHQNAPAVISKLSTWNDAVIALGRFHAIYGTKALGLSLFENGAWSNLPTIDLEWHILGYNYSAQFDARVHTIVSKGDSVIAAGNMVEFDQLAVGPLALYKDEMWSALGDWRWQEVFDVNWHEGELYVLAQKADESGTVSLYKRNSSGWLLVDDGPHGTHLRRLISTPFGLLVHANWAHDETESGYLGDYVLDSKQEYGVSRYFNGLWEPFISSPTNITDYAVQNGTLLISGIDLGDVDGVDLGRLARYDGSSWEPIVYPIVPTTMTVNDSTIYLGTSATTDGTVAKWNGEYWVRAAGNIPGRTLKMVLYKHYVLIKAYSRNNNESISSVKVTYLNNQPIRAFMEHLPFTSDNIQGFSRAMHLDGSTLYVGSNSTISKMDLSNMPGEVKLGYPHFDYTINNLRPQFSWSPAENATEYEVFVSQDSTFFTAHFGGIVQDTTLTIPYALIDQARFHWRVRPINDQFNGVWEYGVFNVSSLYTSIDDETDNLPKKFQVYPAFPNPFNPTTTIRFDLPSTSDVRLEIYDAVGRRVALVADKNYMAGTHSVVIDASRLGSGVYFLRAHTAFGMQSQKVTLIK